MLSLLSRSDGASIAEMMQATDWQQHSVRGFLAGTVKKKLGLLLTTSKAAGDVRRYRIETRKILDPKEYDQLVARPQPGQAR